MGKFICFWLIILTLGTFTEVQAKKKKIRVYRVNIEHYTNSRVKGVLYDVSKEGTVLLDAKAIKNIPYDLIQKAVNEGKLQTTLVPFEHSKSFSVRRKGSVGRGVGFGALSGVVVYSAIVAGEVANNDNDNCGCGGTGLAILFAPAAGAIGGAVGAIVGAVPKKTVVLDPKRPYESAVESYAKYSIVEQLKSL